MFYKLLGYLVWNGGKAFLRARYSSASVPRPLLAVGVLAVVGGVALAAAAAKRNGTEG